MPWLLSVTNNFSVGHALVRYVNSGVTLGAVNLPEVNLRSLTLDESNHARVGFIVPNSTITLLIDLGDLHPSQHSRCFEKG